MTLKNILMAIVCWLVFFSAPIVWARGDGPVSVTLAEVMKQYDIKGVFTAPADPRIAWDVLTDYDHLSQFVHSIRGHIRSENGDDLVVSQVGTGGFLFFTVSVTVLLKIHEDPIHSIVFKDTSGKDFGIYSGSWTLRPLKDGVEVTYHLHAEGNRHTPGFVSGKLLQSTTRDLLNEVRREMERRMVALSKKTPTK